MTTTHEEIADGIHRFATFNADAGIPFCQFLIDADEPLLFHTGHRHLFPVVKEAVSRVTDPTGLRWIAFGHLEADESGSMNEWLGTAPRAEIAHGSLGTMVSLDDLADRPPRGLADGEVIDLGGKRVRHIDTPHVPHGWDARALYEETTGTLFCGDLFTALGDAPATSDADLVGPAEAAEDLFGATALTPATAPTIRKLAALSPARLALMHGPSFIGATPDAAAEQLRRLADAYERRLAAT
jgi:flavorubredoxin